MIGLVRGWVKGVKIGERLGKKSLRLGERLVDSLGERLVES